MRKKKEKIRRGISIAGFLLIWGATVGSICGVDKVRRVIEKPELNTAAIHKDGIFYEDVLESTPPKKPEPTESPEEPTSSPEPTEAPTEPDTLNAKFGESIPDGCVTVPQEKKNVTSGIMLRLDSEHGFTGITGELVTFAEKNDSYRMKNMELTAKSEVVEAMNKMASAYKTVTGKADLMVYSTTAVYAKEGTLYPVELPDRASGYCIDLCILNDDGTISKIQTGNAWLEANAHLYGFVFSYTAEDAEATGIDAAPYHLRYVGKEHAGIMHEEGLTLHQYLDALKKHTVNDPFYYSESGKTWSVYYVPAKIGGTEVPVPLNAGYEISGDNEDGFIVKAEGLIG